MSQMTSRPVSTEKIHIAFKSAILGLFYLGTTYLGEVHDFVKGFKMSTQEVKGRAISTQQL